MRSLSGILLLVDRTMALFVGLAVGAVVTLSFGGGGGGSAVVGVAEASIPAAPAPPAAAARPEPVAPRLAGAVREGRRIEIGVFGDSFGEGIWAGLYNQLRRDPAFEVRQLAERSTGFTRYRSFNILDDIRAKLDRQPVDVAVLSFGANDTQGIYYEGHGHTFMSDGWQAIVTERVTAVVTLLRARGVAVYWVGLPRMRDPPFDADIQAMNRFYAARMAALRVPYIDTLALTVDGRGAYAPYLPAQLGHERQMARANDGIHMTIPGYIHVTRGLTDAIRRETARARAEARAAAAQPRRQG
ncbi:MAG TPA: DUF459 domain-containing protein [Allosphingosinicella sp.]|jgi:hypothetical protein|nr:DUF459 domain-containing protein [Allosphingosinicella sp.]